MPPLAEHKITKHSEWGYFRAVFSGRAGPDSDLKVKTLVRCQSNPKKRKKKY